MQLRLRQLCLVADQLEPVVDTLGAVFDVAVCHRDPQVERFGLHNAVLPLGSSFVEVVAPWRDGTTAGRYLQRRGGDGGYMVILDTPVLAPWRTHMAGVGVRVASDHAHGNQGLSGIDLVATNPQAIRIAAAGHDCPVDAAGVQVGGVQFNLLPVH